jgi:predicted CoA-binding protein
MEEEMTTKASVEKIMSKKRLAIAGVSRTGGKFGNTILKKLDAIGYEMSVIHHEVKEIRGHQCASSLAEVADKVEGLILVTPPKQTEKLVKEAAAAGIDNVWMQQGAESKEAIAFCKENNINAVHGECVMMFAEPAGIHKFHRWLRGVFGRLPKDSD